MSSATRGDVLDTARLVHLGYERRHWVPHNKRFALYLDSVHDTKDFKLLNMKHVLIYRQRIAIRATRSRSVIRARRVHQGRRGSQDKRDRSIPEVKTGWRLMYKFQVKGDESAAWHEITDVREILRILSSALQLPSQSILPPTPAPVPVGGVVQSSHDSAAATAQPALCHRGRSSSRLTESTNEAKSSGAGVATSTCTTTTTVTSGPDKVHPIPNSKSSSASSTSGKSIQQLCSESPTSVVPELDHQQGSAPSAAAAGAFFSGQRTYANAVAGISVSQPPALAPAPEPLPNGSGSEHEPWVGPLAKSTTPAKRAADHDETDPDYELSFMFPQRVCSLRTAELVEDNLIVTGWCNLSNKSEWGYCAKAIKLDIARHDEYDLDVTESVTVAAKTSGAAAAANAAAAAAAAAAATATSHQQPPSSTTVGPKPKMISIEAAPTKRLYDPPPLKLMMFQENKAGF